MTQSNNHLFPYAGRRQRLHELLIGLIQQQENLELMDEDAPRLDNSSASGPKDEDPAKWLNRNRRIMQKYQALVRSAITLDALLDSEESATS